MILFSSCGHSQAIQRHAKHHADDDNNNNNNNNNNKSIQTKKFYAHFYKYPLYQIYCLLQYDLQVLKNHNKIE